MPATDQPPLLHIPLETRYAIFGFAAAANGDPAELLQAWLHNIEQDKLAALGLPSGNSRRGIRTARHSKWRHVSNFLNLPMPSPPTELLLSCKQLKTEAFNWYYKRAVLRIDVTASFRHMTFFEMAMTELAQAPFTPMINMHRVCVVFNWDSALMRTSLQSYTDVISALMHQRISLVIAALKRVAELHELTIVWTDSIDDSESRKIRDDMLSAFSDELQPQKLVHQLHTVPSNVTPSSLKAHQCFHREIQSIFNGQLFF